MIKLFHGSNMAIDVIDLTKGRRGKDFGQGFYLSADKNQAMQMAQTTVERNGGGVPTVTTFLLDETQLNAPTLRICRFEDYSAEWALFVVKNRTNRTEIQVHDYDIVYGPIADDRVGPQIRRFQNKWISADVLMEELKNVRPTFQYFFGTEKAIALLKKE